MFRHPNYYKELRKRNTDQAISSEAGDGECERATGPGHKLQAREDSTANSTRGPSDVRPDPGPKLQAASLKRQAPEASSDKHQAPSSKLQA